MDLSNILNGRKWQEHSDRIMCNLNGHGALYGHVLSSASGALSFTPFHMNLLSSCEILCQILCQQQRMNLPNIPSQCSVSAEAIKRTLFYCPAFSSSESTLRSIFSTLLGGRPPAYPAHFPTTSVSSTHLSNSHHGLYHASLQSLTPH